MSSPASEPLSSVEQWIAAARAGSQEMLGRLLQSCRQYLLLVANQQIEPDLRGKVGGSDVVQETFLEAQRDFAQFQGHSEQELLAWLRQLLLYNLANISRHYRQTEKRQVGREVPLEEVAAGAPGELMAETASPSARLIASEESRRLHEAIDRLPEHYRTVVLLRHRDHLSFEAVGQQTGRSAEAARKVWARAIEMLQEFLEPPHEP